MWDKATWEFINTFAAWAAAIATLLAVVLALHYSRRDRKIRLRVYCGIRKIGSMGVPFENWKDILLINVTNIGHRQAVANSIYWKLGIFRPTIAVQTIMPDPNSSPFPVKLADGEQADYRIPLEEFKKNINVFLEEVFEKTFPELRLKYIKIGAETSTGDRFESRIEESFRVWLREQAEIIHNKAKKP